jgi:hypothetical protein
MLASSYTDIVYLRGQIESCGSVKPNLIPLSRG